MKEYFEEMGCREPNLIVTMDKDGDVMDDTWKKLKKEYFEKADKSGGKVKLLFIVYYSGHGILDMTTKVVVNTSSTIDNDKYWALESKLSILSQYKHNYTMVVFDCCREKKSESTRGNETKDDIKGQNFYCTFGCPSK
jgi:hypothetical protein